MKDNNLTVSIAMAVYNGEKYIREQLNTIIVQLRETDEIIISYDTSSDNTLSIIKEYEKVDPRIHVFKNPNRGVVSNFQNAVMHCSNDIIFLSDQDDIWNYGKIEAVLAKFKDQRVTAVIHDTVSVDNDMNILCRSTFEARGGNTSALHNWIRLSYIGCAMAFRSEMRLVVIPFPTKERSHDWWIGTMCCLFGKMEMIPKPYIYHRIHEENATPKNRPGLKYQLTVRWIIAYNALKRCIRFFNLMVATKRGTPLVVYFKNIR